MRARLLLEHRAHRVEALGVEQVGDGLLDLAIAQPLGLNVLLARPNCVSHPLQSAHNSADQRNDRVETECASLEKVKRIESKEDFLFHSRLAVHCNEQSGI